MQFESPLLLIASRAYPGLSRLESPSPCFASPCLASHGLQCIRPLTASALHPALPHSPSSPSAKTCSFGPCSSSSSSPTAPSSACQHTHTLSLFPSSVSLMTLRLACSLHLPFHPSHLRNHHHLLAAVVEFRSLHLDIPVGTSLPFNRRSPPPRTTLSCPVLVKPCSISYTLPLGLSRSPFSFKPAPPLSPHLQQRHRPPRHIPTPLLHTVLRSAAAAATAAVAD